MSYPGFTGKESLKKGLYLDVLFRQCTPEPEGNEGNEDEYDAG